MPEDVEAIQAAVQAAIDGDDPEAAEQLLPLVYDQLRKLAHQHMRREAPGHSLQTTALVHEAYMRLVGPHGERESGWNGQRHFYGAAAQAMRRILVERARARGAVKRGGDRERLDIDPGELTMDEVPADVIDLDEALTRLAVESPTQAQLVSLRFFGGLTQKEAAAVLEVSTNTADRYWAFARAWLLSAMKGDF